jgi:hypothetical protein
MRNFNKQILNFLEQKHFEENLNGIHKFPPQKTVNVLFSFLCSTDKAQKKRAIMAMGEVVSEIAENDLESARTIMRRLLWSLNEESGWIGWGSAEAMAEIMARNNILAEEYYKFLISYISEGDNYLLFEELRKEVISGLRRLSQVYPHLVKEVGHLLK